MREKNQILAREALFEDIQPVLGRVKKHLATVVKEPHELDAMVLEIWAVAERPSSAAGPAGARITQAFAKYPDEFLAALVHARTFFRKRVIPRGLELCHGLGVHLQNGKTIPLSEATDSQIAQSIEYYLGVRWIEVDAVKKCRQRLANKSTKYQRDTR